MKIPAFLIGGINSGSGKTTLALALMRAFTRRGLRVAPFKCGPDYIDPFFHRQAAGRPSINLDTYLMGQEGVRESFSSNLADADVAVVEGVMGLYDGIRPDSTAGSSAEIASLLDLPVLLAVNARGLSGSIAPLVKGFSEWRSTVRIAGVAAAFTGSPEHALLLRDALKAADLPPLTGTLRRNPKWKLPERHLGLSWNSVSDVWLDELADAIEEEMDLDALLSAVSGSAERPDEEEEDSPVAPPGASVRLAVARDEAFCFYYEDNFRLLRKAGAELVEFSPLHDDALPENIDGVYFGGGFPELYGVQLAGNHSMLESVRACAAQGKWVYGECGGYLYLLDSLTDFQGMRHSMLGLLPGEAKMNERLQSLGYRELHCISDSVFRNGTCLRGHEFHYSSASPGEGAGELFEARNVRNLAVFSSAGALRGTVCGSYAHLHLGSNPDAAAQWTEAMKQ